MSFESPNALKDLLDTTTDCMHELSNLGIQVVLGRYYYLYC